MSEFDIEIVRAPKVVKYGHERIPYETTFADRTTLEIGVDPDGSVHVRAPTDRSPEEIHDHVQRRARWIVRQRRHFDRIGPPTQKKEYVSGESAWYLGRQYRLRVIPTDDGRPDRARLHRPYLEIETEDVSPDHVRQLVEGWYRVRAETRLPERYDFGASQVRRYGIEAPPFSIRRMRTRWGSYTPSGRVLLNPDLMVAPLYCIDYVVVHELCHVRHPNHGTDFYDLLGRVLPDWRTAKARLDRAGR